MGSAKRNLLTSILLLVVMGIFAVLTIFIVVDAINKKYYNDIKVEYEVQEEEDLNNVILTFARNEGSAYSTETVKAVRNPEDETKFRIDGTVPTIENGVVSNLDDLTSSDGREFYFFSTNSSFIDPQEDPENPNFIFSETDSRYYVSTEDNPIWYDVPKSSENLTLYSVFLTPNVHNSDFANAPLLNTSPNVIISHDVTEIPYNAFSDILAYAQSQGQTGVAKIESVVIPNSVESINSEVNYESQIMGGAFALCTTLTNIIIPSSVEDIGSDVFTLCSGLGTIEYENAYYIPTESNEHAILVDSNLKASQVTIHEECISIQGGTFSKYYFMATGLITLGEGATMKDYINMNLQEVTIPKNVKNIGMGAFTMCMGLDNMVFEDNSNLTSIGEVSFMNCSRLKTINLEDTKLEEIGMMTLSITAIEEITLPSTLKTIGEGAFGYCGSLKTVNFENNSQLTSIGEDAFSGCSSLTSITIPSNVTSIGNSTFRNCSSLTSITIPSNVTSIGEEAFYGCSSLTSIIIPESVTSIGGRAFQNCTGLTSITFENMTGLTSIGSYIFDGCDNVNQLTIQSGEVKDLDFRDLGNLTTVILGNGVTSIGDSSFFKCSSLTSITIPSGVTSIGEEAFYGCSSLTSIIIPESVTSIGNYAFYDCSSLETVTFRDNSQLTSIGDRAFQYCSSLTSITIPESVTSIGIYAFYGCSNIQELRIDNLTSYLNISYGDIRSNPLYSANQAGSLYVGGEFITNLVIPDGVTAISNYAFVNLNITSVTIPNSITSIGDYAFYYCDSLTSITIPDSVTSIGFYAFRYCDNLTIYCEASSQPSGWSSQWNFSNRPVYWAGEWKYDEVTGEPVPIESGVEGVGYSDIGEDFGIGFDGLGFREEIYFNDKRERKVV